MNWRVLILIALMSGNLLVAQELSTNTHKNRMTARFDLAYTPISSVKIPFNKSEYDFYDSFAYRLSVEYFVAEYVSIGPGFEYLSRRVSTDGTFSDNIYLYNLYLDGRYSYPITDSGKSYFILGLGSGIANLKEKKYEKGNGFCIYGIIGLDVGIFSNMGIDFLYRYGSTRVTVKSYREYRIERSALQSGFSYRFNL
jgi:hypothetical protein